MSMKVAYVQSVLVVVLLSGCGGDGPSAPSALPPVAAVSSVPEPSPPPVPVPEPPPPPPEPTALERAQLALEEGRHEDVCSYLVTVGVSTVLCGWIVETARAGDDRPLSTDRFERVLRDQHVRRISGTVVGWYDEAHGEYEVRVSGRPAILIATETAFETTGRFSMWAQQHGTSDEVLASGREVSIQVYREWPLYHSILETARATGDAAGPAAVALLRELLRAWETDYCYTPDPNGLGTCYVEAPALPPSAPTGLTNDEAGAAPAVSDERRRECRRTCVSYVDCRELGLSFADCREDLSAPCRACRDEGAIR